MSAERDPLLEVRPESPSPFLACVRAHARASPARSIICEIPCQERFVGLNRTSDAGQHRADPHTLRAQNSALSGTPGSAADGFHLAAGLSASTPLVERIDDATQQRLAQ